MVQLEKDLKKNQKNEQEIGPFLRRGNMSNP